MIGDELLTQFQVLFHFSVFDYDTSISSSSAVINLQSFFISKGGSSDGRIDTNSAIFIFVPLWRAVACAGNLATAPYIYPICKLKVFGMAILNTFHYTRIYCRYSYICMSIQWNTCQDKWISPGWDPSVIRTGRKTLCAPTFYGDRECIDGFYGELTAMAIRKSLNCQFHVIYMRMFSESQCFDD